MFLEAVFEKDAFEQEVERLSHIRMSDGKETNLVLEDNRHFPADAYICEYNWNRCYEYALVFPEALKINYIFYRILMLRMQRLRILFCRKAMGRRARRTRTVCMRLVQGKM